jgi:hypothetical protein
MAALLDAVRKQPPNSFTLWDAATRLQLGLEPPPDAALAMAERIVTAYSSRWPADAHRVITARRLVEDLRADGVDALFSPRPALIAYVAGLMGDAQTGAAETVLEEAVRAAAVKLVQESSQDVARLLLTMRSEDRALLRRLADGQLLGLQAQPHGELRDELEAIFTSDVNVGRLIASLCERDWPPRLLPPYGRLLRSWIEPDGRVAFAVDGDRIKLLPSTHANLVFINDLCAHFSPAAVSAASHAVLDLPCPASSRRRCSKGSRRTVRPAQANHSQGGPPSARIYRSSDRRNRPHAGRSQRAGRPQ